MKSFAGLLFALLMGVAFSWIQPAQVQQVQVDNLKIEFDGGLDNPNIMADGNIRPARKCKYTELLPFQQCLTQTLFYNIFL
jgi:hypothetical protein